MTDNEMMFHLNAATERGGIGFLPPSVAALVYARLSDAGYEGLANIAGTNLAYAGSAAFNQKVQATRVAEAAGLDVTSAEAANMSASEMTARAEAQRRRSSSSAGVETFAAAAAASAATAAHSWTSAREAEDSSSYASAVTEAFYSALLGDEGAFQFLDSASLSDFGSGWGSWTDWSGLDGWGSDDPDGGFGQESGQWWDGVSSSVGDGFDALWEGDWLPGWLGGEPAAEGSADALAESAEPSDSAGAEGWLGSTLASVQSWFSGSEPAEEDLAGKLAARRAAAAEPAGAEPSAPKLG